MPGGLTDAMAGLGIAGGPSQAADNRQPGTSTPTTTPELKSVIMGLIRETLESEKMFSPNFGHENFRDIPLVGPRTGEERGGVPELTKLIKEFSGDRSTFNSWKKNVDRVMAIYEGQEESYKFYDDLSCTYQGGW